MLMPITLRRTICLITFLSLLFSTIAVATSIGQITGDCWETKASMHKARIGLGAATVNDKIYAIGGLGDVTGVGYTSLDINEEYNAVTDSWIYRAPMSTPRYGFAITVWQNKIYCIGGKPPNRQESPSATATDVNEVYDPTTDTWTILKPMPTARMNAQANVVNGKIYLMGGRILDIPDSMTYNLNEVYDPLTDSWSIKTPMPISAATTASTVVDDKIYIFAQGLNMIYDPQNDSWSYGTSPLSNNSAIAGATTGNFAPKQIYVFSDQKVQSYDPKTDSWNVSTLTSKCNFYSALAILDDKFYVLGGFKFRPTDNRDGPSMNAYQEEYTGDNQQYTPIGYNKTSPSNTTLPSKNTNLTLPTDDANQTALPTDISNQKIETSSNQTADSNSQDTSQSWQSIVALSAVVGIVVMVTALLMIYFKKHKH